VHKPSPKFFSRALELMAAKPGNVAYVGDRLDNDVVPASAAGMHAVWLLRGPWAQLAAATPPDGTIVVRSLTELAGALNK
jgi:FMN phosphatase YigB (HAD superfamily)